MWAKLQSCRYRLEVASAPRYAELVTDTYPPAFSTAGSREAKHPVRIAPARKLQRVLQTYINTFRECSFPVLCGVPINWI